MPIPAGSSTLSYRIGFDTPERAKVASHQVEQARPRPKLLRRRRSDEVPPGGGLRRRPAHHLRVPARRAAAGDLPGRRAGRESIINVRETETGAVVMGTSDRWTLRVGDGELCVAHERVIKTVPGGRRAKALRSGYLVATSQPASAIPGLPK